MLDPDYLERAGDMVAAVYGEIEAEMTTYLARLLLDQDLEELGQRGQIAVNLLAQSAAPALMAILEKARPDVSRAVAETVEDALRRSDAADARRLGGKLPEDAASSLPRQMELTARGIAEILERDNVEMTAAALDLWNRCVAEAAAKANSGAATAEQAVRAAVRRMMREGCSWVQYRDSETGRQTVANRVDVAVRRHVRTQLHQDGMRRTLDVCERAGVRLVEVSSHGGARPEHARWQGRVYSLDGDVTIDGRRYKDFYRETGYGKVDGLGGAHCRHDFGPWIPGTPRMHEPDPPHPSGLANDEVYALAQGQRRRERGIRDAKRELAAAQLIADKDPSLANVAEVERAKAKLRGRQKSMRDFIAEANAKGDAPVLRRAPAREWAGDMPKVRKSDASRRAMGEFLDGAGVKRTLKARGMTKAEARAALTEELDAHGVPARDFAMLGKTTQQNMLKAVLPERTPIEGGRRQFRRIAGEHAAKDDLIMVNPGFGSRKPKWTRNCQRCVAAYEMRRRGYDVVAKPRETDGSGVLVEDKIFDEWMSIFKGARFEVCSGSGKTRCDRLMQRWGDGARAEVYVKWHKTRQMKIDPGAHVFVAENRGGEIVYIDPQTGREHVEGYFKKAERGFTMIARIDKLEPSHRIDGCCTSRKGGAQ